MPRTTGTGLSPPPKATSNPRTERTGPVMRMHHGGALYWRPSRFEPDRSRDQQVVDVEGEPADILCRHNQPGVVGIGRNGEGRLHHDFVKVIVSAFHVRAGSGRSVDAVDGGNIFGMRMWRSEDRVVGCPVDAVRGYAGWEFLNVADGSKQRIEPPLEQRIDELRPLEH